MCTKRTSGPERDDRAHTARAGRNRTGLVDGSDRPRGRQGGPWRCPGIIGPDIGADGRTGPWGAGQGPLRDRPRSAPSLCGPSVAVSRVLFSLGHWTAGRPGIRPYGPQRALFSGAAGRLTKEPRPEGYGSAGRATHRHPVHGRVRWPCTGTHRGARIPQGIPQGPDTGRAPALPPVASRAPRAPRRGIGGWIGETAVEPSWP
jgi:hypothetical protein